MIALPCVASHLIDEQLKSTGNVIKIPNPNFNLAPIDNHHFRKDGGLNMEGVPVTINYEYSN